MTHNRRKGEVARTDYTFLHISEQNYFTLDREWERLVLFPIVTDIFTQTEVEEEEIKKT